MPTAWLWNKEFNMIHLCFIEFPCEINIVMPWFSYMVWEKEKKTVWGVNCSRTKSNFQKKKEDVMIVTFEVTSSI